jgi:two-component system cell cycle sensor histidine kinase/response regulator CckA
MSGQLSRVLIVEDESITALHIKTILDAKGYFVPAIVASGDEAIELARELNPDLVLMDIRLRGNVDGIEAAQAIRRKFDVPVVYLTAYADPETTERARLTEPYGYLLKPFDERELMIVVEMALYRHRMERKLKESERWLTATLRSIGDSVIATDAEWRIRFMNPRAESLTGWTADLAIGKELAEVVRVSLTANPRPLSPSVALAGGGFAEGILTARDGSEIAVEENSTTIRDERGRVLGTVIAIRKKRLDPERIP